MCVTSGAGSLCVWHLTTWGLGREEKAEVVDGTRSIGRGVQSRAAAWVGERDQSDTWRGCGTSFVTCLPEWYRSVVVNLSKNNPGQQWTAIMNA